MVRKAVDVDKLGDALMCLTESLQDVAAQCAGYRDKLEKEFGYTPMAAEAMSMHLHMRLVEMMVTHPK